MLYAKIAFLALFALILFGSPARLPHPQAEATLRAIQKVNLRSEHPMYLALCRPARLAPDDKLPIVLLPEDEGNGTASLRVKTRASA